MDLGFATIGNATLICHDQRPVLVTDPWITGPAYFGSWSLPHDLPPQVLDDIKHSQYVWVSHGHPDHFSPRSLDLLQDKQILLADHVGGRIYDGLRERGFNVTILRDRQWYPISDRIRILSIADYNQDSILLVDIGGRLIINFNDANDRGWGPFVKRTIRNYKVSFHLQLLSNDADMINIWTEDGAFVGAKVPAEGYGPGAARLTRTWGTRYFVPFSSLHVYQRSDSVWANQYRIPVTDYQAGFNSKSSEILPPFIQYDLVKDRCESLNPPGRTIAPIEPKEFGDDWSEPLDAADRPKISQYFKAISHLEKFIDFVAVRVGGNEHVVELASRKFHRGLTFEAPRNSLMTAIENEIFDDLLIGNFMKTTLHGSFTHRALYPHFSPYVAKYADNGLAKSPQELDMYFKTYARRAPLDYLKHSVVASAVNLGRSSLQPDSSSYVFAKRTYHWLKEGGRSIPGRPRA